MWTLSKWILPGGDKIRLCITAAHPSDQAGKQCSGDRGIRLWRQTDASRAHIRTRTKSGSGLATDIESILGVCVEGRAGGLILFSIEIDAYLKITFKKSYERQISYDITCMWNLKNDTREFIYKTENRLTNIDNKLMVTKGGRRGRD